MSIDCKPGSILIVDSSLFLDIIYQQEMQQKQTIAFSFSIRNKARVTNVFHGQFNIHEIYNLNMIIE